MKTRVRQAPTVSPRPLAPPPAMSRLIPSEGALLALLSLGMAAAVVLAYGNSLSGPFIFDDELSIQGNPYIRKLWPLARAMFHAPPDSPPAGRPVVSLSLAINYALGGFRVFGYHLFNIAVHLASALALWAVLRQALSKGNLKEHFGRSAPFLAFAAALIWAVHPLQTEAVTYISQRTELLMGLFYLLTLYCALRAWQPARPGLWSAGAVVSCAIGMGCKETMVSAPLMVLLLDALLVSGSLRQALRRHIRLYAGLAATWGLLAWLILSGPRSASVGLNLGVRPLDYLRTQAGILVWYLRLCFWPHPLVISYQDWPLARRFLPILPQGLLIVALLALTVWAFCRRRPVALLGAWFFLILAPTSSFVPIITETAAERRMHLPLAAVILAVVIGCHELYGRVVRRGEPIPRAAAASAAAPAAILLLLTAGVLGTATFLRNRDYRTAVGVWTDAVAKRPKNSYALNNLARAVMDAGDNEKGLQYCTQAIELEPANAEAYNNRGYLYNQKGDFNRAMADLTRAIGLKSGFAEAYSNRGNACVGLGDISGAIRDFSRALELNPNLATAHINRGNAYGKTGAFDRAVVDYTEAIGLDPSLAPAYNNRGNAYSAQREFDLAIRDFTRAVELEPAFADAYYNRGNAYSRMGDAGRSILDFTKAIELRPGYAEAYYNRGNGYFGGGEFNRAIEDYGRAIEAKPDYAQAYHNRGIARGQLGQIDQEIRDCSRAIELKPDYAEAHNSRAYAYYLLKDYEKARADIEACRRLGGLVSPELIKELGPGTVSGPGR